MSEVTITLYEALERKKRMQNKMVRILEAPQLTAVMNYDYSVSIKGATRDEVDKALRSNYDSSIQFIKNYYEITRAINQANATIKVVIASQEYTIADAIVRQRNIRKEEMFWTTAKNEIEKMKLAVENNNSINLTSDAKARYIQTILGDSKKDETMVKALGDKYEKENKKTFYDPLKLDGAIDNILDEIREFNETIHTVLTTANCTHSITISFVD